MKALDAFLLRHDVDVGRGIGLLVIAGAVEAFFKIIAHILVGKLDLNVGVPLGIWIGIALWRHEPWSRTLLVIVCWAATAFFVVILVGAPFIGTAKLTLKLGDAVIKNPPLWQIYASTVLFSPFLWFSLVILYSEKAKSEFRKRVTPDAGNSGEIPENPA